MSFGVFVMIKIKSHIFHYYYVENHYYYVENMNLIVWQLNLGYKVMK